MLYDWHDETGFIWCESIPANPKGTPDHARPLQMGGRVLKPGFVTGSVPWRIEVDVDDSIFCILQGRVTPELFPEMQDRINAAKANVECLLDLFASGNGDVLGHAAVMSA